jgi:hypothetical protein
LKELESGAPGEGHDASTRGLLAHYRALAGTNSDA